MQREQRIRRAIERLAAGALRGDPAGAWSLVERAWPALTRFVLLRLRHTGIPHRLREDCGQNVFIRVWKYRKGYRGGSEGEFWAWIRRICDNEHRRLCKGEAGNPRAWTDLEPDSEDTGLSDREATRPREAAPPGETTNPTLEGVLERERTVSLRRCLAQCGPRARRILEWIYFEPGMSERAVASLLGCSPSYVHKLKSVALAELRRCLERSRRRGAQGSGEDDRSG